MDRGAMRKNLALPMLYLCRISYIQNLAVQLTDQLARRTTDQHNIGADNYQVGSLRDPVFRIIRVETKDARDFAGRLSPPENAGDSGPELFIVHLSRYAHGL